MLGRVVERARSGTGSRFVVFDLDGTLIDNRPRSTAILLELAELWLEQHPEVAARLRDADPDRLDYLFADNLRRLGVTADAQLQAAVQFWHARFFTDAYLRHDRPVAGALDFARACHRAGATLVYLTGRDLPNMALGTFASLRDLGFPIGVPGSMLVLKPDFETPDEEFKRVSVPSLARLGEVVAAFDNEPGNCNLLREAWASAEVCLVDTQHLPGAPALAAGIDVIADFRMEQ